MAIQVDNTTVIDDSRNINNVNSVTSTGTVQGNAVTSVGPITGSSITATGALESNSILANSLMEQHQSLGSSTSPTINCSQGNVFSVSLSGDTIFSFSNVPSSGTAYGVTVEIYAIGTHTVTWPSSVKWAGGTAPDAPANGETDIIGLYTRNGGTTWYGFLAGDAMS